MTLFGECGEDNIDCCGDCRIHSFVGCGALPMYLLITLSLTDVKILVKTEKPRYCTGVFSILGAFSVPAVVAVVLP